MPHTRLGQNISKSTAARSKPLSKLFLPSGSSVINIDDKNWDLISPKRENYKNARSFEKNQRRNNYSDLNEMKNNNA